MDPKSRISKKFTSLIDVEVKTVVLRGNPPIIPVIRRVS